MTVPVYGDASWKGYVLNNPQIYLGWVTPEEHPAIQAAVTAYQGVVSPHVDGKIGDRRRPHQGAARRPLGLLHRRRRLPGPEGSEHPGRAPGRSGW